MSNKNIEISPTQNYNTINVESANNSSFIELKNDSTQYYSNLSKNWATKLNGLVAGEDYSAKYYAQKASTSHNNAENCVTKAENIYNEIITLTEDTTEAINMLKNNTILELETSKESAIQNIENKVLEESNELEKIANDIEKTLDTTLSKTQVSNCILEIPQRIKLESNNDVLTLKAGSQVIIPNGFEEDGVTPKFDYVTIEDDITAELGSTNSGLCVVLYDSDRNKVYANVLASSCASGTTTVTTDTGYFYNTSTNILTFHNTGTYEDRLYSLPFALINKEENTLLSIDQVLNGIGYIGSTVWIDKGVKCLIPNGRNEDGTLNNIEYTTNKMFMHTESASKNEARTILLNMERVKSASQKNTFSQSIQPNLVGGTAWFNPADNTFQLYDENEGWISDNVIFCGSYEATNGKISNFTFRQPIRLVDSSMIDGLWVNYSNNIAQNVSLKENTTYTYDLSSFLPKDGYTYEAIFSATVETLATTGSQAEITLYTPTLSSAQSLRVASCITRTNATARASGAVTLPITPDRTLLAHNIGKDCTLGYLRIYAYRRLGTNL